MKKVSVIILNWNGTSLMRRYLPSVVKFSNAELADIIVADNGSTDESIEVLNNEFPSVKIIRLNQNYGFAKGYNLAINQVDTPYTILLNDDVRVTDNWLQPLVNYMEAHPEVGALQPKLMSDRKPSKFEYAGAAGGYLDCLGYPYCRGRIFDNVEEDHGQYDDIKQIMWATGACLMVRTPLYKELGGLDEHFFAHMEEIDLCWRMRNYCYSLVCLPEVKVFHYGGASLSMGDPRKTKLNFRNSLLMLYKNLPIEVKSKKIFLRKCLDGVAAMNFFLHGQFDQVKAIWTAHREADKMINEIYKPLLYDKITSKEGQPLFSENTISILVEYYIKGKKTFDAIFTK